MLVVDHQLECKAARSVIWAAEAVFFFQSINLKIHLNKLCVCVYIYIILLLRLKGGCFPMTTFSSVINSALLSGVLATWGFTLSIKKRIPDLRAPQHSPCTDLLWVCHWLFSLPRLAFLWTTPSEQRLLSQCFQASPASRRLYIFV